MQRFIVVFILLCSQPIFALSMQEITTKQNELTNIASHIEQLQKSLIQTQARQFDLQQQLKINATEIRAITQQMMPLNIQFSAALKELNKIKKMRQIALSQLHIQQTTLAQQLRVIYRLGQTPSLKSLLAPDNKSDRYLYYYRYLNMARLTLVTRIKQMVTSVNTNMAMLAEQEHTLDLLLQKKQQRQHQLQQIQSKRQAILAELSAQTSLKKHELIALLNSQRTIQNLLRIWS